MAEFAYLGPPGKMRPIPSPVQGSWAPVRVRAESEFISMGGVRYLQTAPRSSRTWELMYRNLLPQDQAYLAACADGSVRGAIHLLTPEARRRNMLPSDLASPGSRGASGFTGTVGEVKVRVGTDTTLVPVSAVQQGSVAGAWSRTIVTRPSQRYALTAWSHLPAATVEVRTVKEDGSQLSYVGVGTATVQTGVSGSFQSRQLFTPVATSFGIQIRLVAGSAFVGALRLVEATAADLEWYPGEGVPEVAVRDTQETLQSLASGRADYSFQLQEVGL